MDNLTNSEQGKLSYQLLDRENPVFGTFIVWSSILVLKFLFMSFLTAFQRFKTKTPASVEDASVIPGVSPTETPERNENVERVRRAHRNDMENILPYLSVGLFYVMTDPNPLLATVLFRVTTIARLIHTFVYAIYVVPQPARAICYAIHMFITIFMAIMCIVYFV